MVSGYFVYDGVVGGGGGVLFNLYPFKFSAVLSVDSIIILKIVVVEFAMDHYVRFEIPRNFKIGVERHFLNMYDVVV